MVFGGTVRLISAKLGLRLTVYLSLLLIGANCQKTHPDEVNALRSIKKSLIDPLKHLRYWKRGDPCASKWTGIICHNISFEDGYRHVQELMLLDRNLSGNLSPELGRLSRVEIIDFMWNNISGTIPKEIGSISTLRLLLLSGNLLNGSLPDELGNLSNLDRIQIDSNRISGQIPKSFANLRRAKHFHMNNNSLSGQIPPELSQLPILIHLLLDNNNLSGYLPPELSELPRLIIFQLDNNNFTGSIPSSYSNMPLLLKLSLRNCSLEGPIPDWSNMSDLAYIDLSGNSLSGSIPTGVLSKNITTIDLSNNDLNGTIPSSFAKLPRLQKLSLANNSLTGSIPSIIWQNRTLNASEKLILDFEHNMLSDISGSLVITPNVSIGFQGNPLCSNTSLSKLCGPHDDDFSNVMNATKLNECPANICPPSYEYAPASPVTRCLCVAPLYVGYRMKSPGFSDFLPYIDNFEEYLTTGLGMHLYQLVLNSAIWEKGPRLRMQLTIFPSDVNETVRIFNRSEVSRIRGLFSGWNIHDNRVFGPFELLSFSLPDAYDDEFLPSSPSGIRKGVLAGIILGTIAGTVTLSLLVALLFFRWRSQKQQNHSKRRLSSRASIKINGVRNFTYAEMILATDNFNQSSQVGRGGYGRVYRGVLADGKIVAIKRAQEGSLQGEKEFLTEIELLSRLHHRNLVSLVGYCDEEGEQMLVYEFIPNGTLREHLSGDVKAPLDFAMRVRTALGAARGILYLHTEANPPIFHRDIKASNILLDSKYTAKVADFGLSRLAPIPELEGSEPSHVSTVVKGTPGYLDPEYFLTHKLTDKSDVYSLGVVFMELLTGLQPIFHGKNLVREVNAAYHSGIIFSIIDDSMGSYEPKCVEKFVNLALNCCQDETGKRPSMAKVVRELENIWLMMPESDTKISVSSVSKPGKEATPPSSSNDLQSPYGVASSSSSSTNLRTPFISEDISGADLVSGVIPTVGPR